MGLLQMAKVGWLSQVKWFIEQGSDINAVNSCGQTALFLACEHGHVECVDLLLKHGADVHCADMNGETAMTVALEKMNVPIILLLVDHGIRPDIQLDVLVPVTMLFSDANAKYAKTIYKMLSDEILSLKSSEDLLAAFKFAFKHSSVELASHLMAQHSDLNMEQVYPFSVYYSVRNNWYDIVKELLMKGADVNIMTESRTPLYAACEQLDEVTVDLLLQHGADPNLLCLSSEPWDSRYETALHAVCVNSGKSALHIVMLLLTHGGDINAVCEKGETALYRACECQQAEVVKLLLDHSADVNVTTSDSYPLIAACTVYEKDVVSEEFASQFGAVTLSDSSDVKQRHTSLASECEPEADSTSVTIIKLLLKYGASVNSQCSVGDTALHRAIRCRHTDAVCLLLEAGAVISHVTHSSTRHPLYIACDHGFARILDILLRHCRPSSQLSLTVTNLLCIAVEKAFVDVAEVLVKHGADANVAFVSEKPALLYAVENCSISLCNNERDAYCRLVRLLVEAGADVHALSLIHI